MAVLDLILLLIPALESSYLTHCLMLGFATLLLWHSQEEAAAALVRKWLRMLFAPLLKDNFLLVMEQQ